MNKRFPMMIGLLCTGLALWCLISPLPMLQHIVTRLEYLGYDIQMRMHIFSHRPRIGPIVIVDIDDKSLKAEGHWPWPRRRIAQLVDRLKQNQVSLIAFDIFFPEKQDNPITTIIDKLSQQDKLTAALKVLLEDNKHSFDDDRLLSDSMATIPVILPLVFLPQTETANALPPPMFQLTADEKIAFTLTDASGYISNIPILQNKARASGFIDIFADEDGVMRRAPILLEYQKGVYAALSLQVLLAYLNQHPELVTYPYYDTRKVEGIRVGDYVIPVNEHGMLMIPFIGRSYTFPYYSATDLLNNRIPSEKLIGKIVLIGSSATGLGDLKATAIQNPFPGVEIQASLINGMLLHNLAYAPTWVLGLEMIVTVLLGICGALLFPFLGPRILMVIMILFPIAVLYLNDFIWLHTGLILFLLIPVFLTLVIAAFNLAYGYLFETRRREKLKKIFGQYVPAKHINEMLQSREQFAMRGESRHMTVLFADIRNFTNISEKMKASEVVCLLNDYFTPMTEIIHKHRGTIDKYIGDLIMAFWGAPLKDALHVTHALSSALEMQQGLERLRQLNAAKWPELRMGIGVNTGVMNVGDMGSKFRRNYTVLGDAVNLGSRIESLTKFYGVEILVSEYTAHNQPQFVFRKIDRVRVKGKQKPIDLFELVALTTQLSAALKEEMEHYHEALACYFDRNWEKAYKKMQILSQLYPTKQIYQIYMSRAQVYQATPPPLDWDGTHVHYTK